MSVSNSVQQLTLELLLEVNNDSTFYRILSTNSLRKSTETSSENLYVDISPFLDVSIVKSELSLISSRLFLSHRN